MVVADVATSKTSNPSNTAHHPSGLEASPGHGRGSCQVIPRPAGEAPDVAFVADGG
jgi:hypothetical protein